MHLELVMQLLFWLNNDPPTKQIYIRKFNFASKQEKKPWLSKKDWIEGAFVVFEWDNTFLFMTKQTARILEGLQSFSVDSTLLVHTLWWTCLWVSNEWAWNISRRIPARSLATSFFNLFLQPLSWHITHMTPKGFLVFVHGLSFVRSSIPFLFSKMLSSTILLWLCVFVFKRRCKTCNLSIKERLNSLALFPKKRKHL